MKITPNTRLNRYVAENLSRELAEVKRRNTEKANTVLSLEEQALIYKYTEDGYLGLNEKLRNSEGKEISSFGELLNNVISKLPNYEDFVYRAASLSLLALKKYKEAKEKNLILVEHSFISCSKSKAIAYQFGKNCQFTIVSRTGKDIEEFAKYGIGDPQNEKEILFRPNLRLRVLEITKEGAKTLIRLEELETK